MGSNTTAIVTFPNTLEGAQRRMITQSSVALLERQCHELEILHCDHIAKYVHNQSLQQLFSLSKRAVSWKVLARLV